jgi:hypothetical protein
MRSQHHVLATAMRVALNAEMNYLDDPQKDHHLWNYALHQHVVVQDTDRARRLYIEALTRMERAVHHLKNIKI